MKRHLSKIYDTYSPERRKAIDIMEFIADYLKKSTIFDCKNGDTKWYDVEDELTNIIEGK